MKAKRRKEGVKLKTYVGLADRFQLWLWQLFVVEEHYRVEDLEIFIDKPLERMYLFEEFIQTEFLVPYTEDFVKDQLEQFTESLKREKGF